MTEDVLQLGPEALSEIVEKKATCPFVGTAVAMRRLPVRNEAMNPLADVEDVRRLGNTGGGDLGDLLVLFATGNHAFMRGPDDQLDQRVPDGLFSLEFSRFPRFTPRAQWHSGGRSAGIGLWPTQPS